MTKRWISLGILVILLLGLTGCLYPDSELLQNKIPLDQSIAGVHDAIKRFQADKGVLPIKTREGLVPDYEKYVVDFGQLIPQYLQIIPPNAFEEGGTYMYVIVDAEKDPQVKLIDLVLYDQVNEMQRRVSIYWNTVGKLPTGEMVDKPYHLIDYDALKIAEPELKSPVTDDRLNILLNAATGIIGLDYSNDLQKIVQGSGIQEWDKDRDVRDLWLQNSYFVPIKSFRYIWNDGKPKPEGLGL
jgi:hypothetical protein